jgi:hypothetical protein
MDNSNSLSQSILQSSEGTFSSIGSSSDDSGFFSGLQNINATTWILIILILAFLGFNIFTYLAKGTQDISNVFAPLLEKIFGTTASVAGQTIDVSAEGAKAVVGETAGAIESGLTAVQNITPNSSVNLQSVNKALNTSQSKQPISQDYEADYANSSIQGGGKASWCYIGDDRGFRTCAQVGVNDKCMSGEIFPSQEICMNPNLRP